ncbi:MAG: class I SAM-dependent methyltransferase [Thermodesulfovibrionales bacterium]|nr:class I SAM-dependent methyltransferase [Thermodesulfovibrionales bacterium]
MMDKINVFDKYAEEYDEWFDVHPWVYRSEVQAVKIVLPQAGKGIEIGTGTGRFSVLFGITIGVEPSETMAEIARSRGITVYESKAENLPFDDSAFDFALMVTTICFLNDPLQALREIRRILRPSGKIIIGMLDEDSPPGKEYDSKKKSSKFYEYAEFYSVKQVVEWLRILGYNHIHILQTIFQKPDKITALEPVREGHGEGLFVVISAEKTL